jgi:hypothetical protein
MFKETVKGAFAEIVEGMREWLQLFGALIAAPFLVCKEFVTSTGRWAPRRDDTPANAAGDRTAV